MVRSGVPVCAVASVIQSDQRYGMSPGLQPLRPPAWSMQASTWCLCRP